MKFIVLLLIFGMNRYWVGPHPLFREESFGRVRDWIDAREPIGDDGVGTRTAWLVGLPVVAALLLFWIVRDWLFGIVWILGAVAVLAFSVDISRLSLRIQQHLQWLKGVKAGASLVDAREYHRQFRKQMVYEEFEGLYTQVFWFLLLGPAGALLYRMAQYCATLESADEGEEPAFTPGDLIQVLEWVPARVSGLSYAVVGNFSSTVGGWVASLTDWRAPTADVLDALATASTGEEDEEPEEVTAFILASERDAFHLRDLMGRSLIFWLALIALLVLLGWV